MTDEEYHAAMARLDALAGCIEGSPEEAELDRLAEAVEAYEATRDPA